MYSEITKIQMNISFDNLSPKQLICECLDLASSVLAQLLKHYLESQGESSPYQKVGHGDLSRIIGHITDPGTLDNILEFLNVKENFEKSFIKTWLFEMRGLRNAWAHSNNLDYRLVHRSFDTLQLLMGKFGANKETEIYKKVNAYRKLLVVKIAQEYLMQEQKQASLFGFRNNGPHSF